MHAAKPTFTQHASEDPRFKTFSAPTTDGGSVLLVLDSERAYPVPAAVYLPGGVNVAAAGAPVLRSMTNPRVEAPASDAPAPPVAPLTAVLADAQVDRLAQALRPAAPVAEPKPSALRRALLIAGALLGIALAVAGGVVAGSAIASQLPTAVTTTR